MENKLEIELEDWEYTCGDGCCYMYGTELRLNGEKLFDPENPEGNSFVGDNVESALRAVLTKLGYKVEIKHV